MPRKIETIKKAIAKEEKRQLERILRGRTRGAGAGGFNRDVDAIVHNIRLLEIELEQAIDL
ncbi:MAG: hypothetical protein AAF662_09910 [Pseudomonadota bacterium]